MQKSSRAKTGCLVVVSVALLLVLIGAFQWLKPIDIEVPLRKYPSNNAYDQLKRLSEQFQAATEKDARLKRGGELILRQVGSKQPALTQQERADIQYALTQYEPYRQKIVSGLKRPSKTVLEYRHDWSFSEMAQFRQFARYDAYLMKQAHERKDFNRVVSLYEAGMTFAQQVDNEGVLIHYLVVVALEAIYHNRFLQSLPELNGAQCERISKFLRQHFKGSTSLSEIFSQEKWYAIQFLKDFQSGKLSNLPEDDFIEDDLSPIMRYSNLNWAAREVIQKYKELEAELKKPANQQNLPIKPIHPVNQLTFGITDSIGYASAQRDMHLRATACAAAVRAFKLKTGRYPKTLKEAGVQDLNVDPYTGGELIYKVDPAKGFLIYSVGADGVDDGGRLAESRNGKGDVSYRLPVRKENGTHEDAAIWLK